MRKKIVLPIVAGMLVLSTPIQTSIFSSIPAAHAAAAAVTYKLVQTGESMVSTGVKQVSYKWVPSDASQTTEVMHVVQVDLNNPYVQLNAMGGKNGSVTMGQSVSAMAKETNAVAGINADVFNTTGEGAPIGAQILSGELKVSTSRIDGMFAFAVTQDRKARIDNFEFQGQIITEAGTSFDLAGINKQLYYADPGKTNSHVNSLYVYTKDWTAPERPSNSGTTPTEALIVDGIVQEISPNMPIATPIPANGYILRGHGTAAQFITGQLVLGAKVISSYTMRSLTTGELYDPSTFQMMVGGHTILMDQGKPAAFSRDIRGVSGSANRARTAVGCSEDGKTVYLVTVEENGGRNGVTLAELQKMLTQIGVWKAVNLDGGGSTTMVTRPLGDFNVSLTHPTSYGTTQRQVADGIGVYTTAPAGDIKGIVASGAETLFIGQDTSYNLKAYDTHYNPIDPAGLQPQWSISSPIGAFQDGRLTASKPGKATVTVQAGAASDTLNLEVIGQEQIEQLTVEPGAATLTPGAVISVPVRARLKDGREFAVPAASIKWEFKGFTAEANAGKLTIKTVNDGVQAGFAIARYDGLGTAAYLTPGTESKLEDFENVNYPIEFSGLPQESAGSASVITGVPGRESSPVLSLMYDFTNGTGSRFAYANLNKAGGGINVPGTPSAMTIDVLGDASQNFVRAEFVQQADGKKVLVDIARKMDWSGWRTVRMDLAAAGVKGPAKLTKLYLVNLAEGQDERPLQGQIAFDNLSLQYPPKTFTPKKPKIVMTVGKSKATVDGKPYKLPAAPFMLKGVNYLPLRFVADTLGGDINWNGKEKRVTILRGDTMLELWVGKSEVTQNGARLQVLAAPILRNGSTCVPVRVVSEQLGQKVEWDGKTKTVTIH